MPATRESRVSRIKALIERGAYKVEGEQIAGAMLADEATARLLGVDPGRDTGPRPGKDGNR
jgi:hypothetical protein